MRLIKLRAISVATSLALLAGASAIGQLARAEAGGPTVVLSSASAATTNSALIPVTVTFSEAVGGFVAGDISATNATVLNFAASSTASTTVFVFDLDPTADGTVTAQVAADVASSTSASTGNQASNMLSFTSDTTLPTITRTVTVGPTSATIDWTTNEPARGQVNYGLTSSYTASTTFEASATTTHSVTLTGLTPSTTYHYEVTAQDVAGNANTTGDLAFTTSAAVAAPVISSVAASGVGTSTATVTWTTDVAATGQVFFGTTTAYGSSTTLNAVASTSHSATISGLTPSTLYHFNVASTNAGGTSTSSDMTFTTSSTTATTLSVTGVDAVNTIALPDGTYQNGFRWIIHFTVPDSETSFAMKFNDFTTTSSSGTIPVAGNLRYSSPQSSNASTTATGVVETNNDYGTALTLTGDASATTPGRQIDVTVELKVPVGTPSGVYSTLFGARSL